MGPLTPNSRDKPRDFKQESLAGRCFCLDVVGRRWGLHEQDSVGPMAARTFLKRQRRGCNLAHSCWIGHRGERTEFYIEKIQSFVGHLPHVRCCRNRKRSLSHGSLSCVQTNCRTWDQIILLWQEANTLQTLLLHLLAMLHEGFWDGTAMLQAGNVIDILGVNEDRWRESALDSKMILI